MFGVAVLAVPGGLAATGRVVCDSGLLGPIVVAGAVGGYSYAIWYRAIRKIGVARANALNISYAMWGVLFAWGLQRGGGSVLAVAGCAVVTAGAVLTIISGNRMPRGRTGCGAAAPSLLGQPHERQAG
jgi:drug/metabolite transporter (DMT)-like permease